MAIKTSQLLDVLCAAEHFRDCRDTLAAFLKHQVSKGILREEQIPWSAIYPEDEDRWREVILHFNHHYHRKSSRDYVQAAELAIGSGLSGFNLAKELRRRVREKKKIEDLEKNYGVEAGPVISDSFFKAKMKEAEVSMSNAAEFRARPLEERIAAAKLIWASKGLPWSDKLQANLFSPTSLLPHSYERLQEIANAAAKESKTPSQVSWDPSQDEEEPAY